MSEAEMETEESVTAGWTKENLQKLLAAMKASIPKQERGSVYNKALKAVDWNEVAFPPFSPEACQQKCRDILKKMRKLRTLTELIVEMEEVVSNPAHNRKIHPELPKKPNPPNAIYYEENWATYHKQRPKLSPPNLIKYVSKKYKGLPDEEKAPYVEKFKVANEEYHKRMLKFRKQYEKPPDAVSRKCRRKKKVSVDTTNSENEKALPPKPPQNGYSLFCKDQLMCMGGVPRTAYVSVWAQRWRGLGKKQRDIYADNCTELKRQYTVQLNEYLKGFDKKDHQQILSENGIKIPKFKKGHGRKKKKLPGEPKMPSQSPNVIFCKTQMKLVKKKIPNSQKCFTEVNKMWRRLSQKEKEPYEEQVLEQMSEYSMELQKWFKTLTAAEQRRYQLNNPSKCRFLVGQQIQVSEGEPCLYIPSDSEDTDITENSSSYEEELLLDWDEDEEEEEEEDDNVIMFDTH